MISEREIREVVEKVMGRISAEAPAAASASVGDGLFSRMEDAIAAARVAHERLLDISLDTRRGMLEGMRRTIIDHARELAELAVSETGMGRVEDKVSKNIHAAKSTPGIEDITPTAYSGDHGLTIEEYGPWGVVGAISPSTNPSETFTQNSIAMIAAGNAVVYNPHPGAKKVSHRTLALLNEAVINAGGPPNLMASIIEPTLETGKILFEHPGIDLICVTGGPGVVREAMKSNKRVLAAGPGNPPVVVDETADIDQAGRDIVRGASFDNNIVCIAEKEVFVRDTVCDALKASMKRHGGYELRGFELERLMKVMYREYQGPKSRQEGGIKREFIGRDAAVLAKAIDITVPSSVRLLFAETSFDHPLVWSEQLTSIIPIVRCRNVDEAIGRAIEAEHNFRHTAMMHSTDIRNLHKMSRAFKGSIFVKNGPCFAGLGFEGEGPGAYTITTPTGEGVTTPRTFTRKRRCVLKDAFRII